MSKQESWYAQLAALANRYGEDVVRAAEQHLGAHFADRPREEWLAAIEHLAALRTQLKSWEAIERTSRAIASGRPAHIATEPQRAAIAIMPGTGRRGKRAADVVLIEVKSPTAGYATLAACCSDAITLSAGALGALKEVGIRHVFELVARRVDELGRIDGITATDLAAIIRFCDKFGLPLGAKLDSGVLQHVRAIIDRKE